MRIFFLYREARTPLGRWCNCGDYYNPKLFYTKMIQKMQREKMRSENKDPYLLCKKKDETIDEYMMPYIFDW